MYEYEIVVCNRPRTHNSAHYEYFHNGVAFPSLILTGVQRSQLAKHPHGGRAWGRGYVTGVFGSSSSPLFCGFTLPTILHVGVAQGNISRLNGRKLPRYYSKLLPNTYVHTACSCVLYSSSIQHVEYANIYYICTATTYSNLYLRWIIPNNIHNQLSPTSKLPAHR